MDAKELTRLLAAERVAFERCELFRGYPGDVQTAALSTLNKARAAIAKYRAAKR